MKHLTGTSTIIVNETMRDYIICSLDNVDLMKKCVDKDGFCDVHELLKTYGASYVSGGDVREAIHLKQGDILIFFGCILGIELIYVDGDLEQKNGDLKQKNGGLGDFVPPLTPPLLTKYLDHIKIPEEEK